MAGDFESPINQARFILEPGLIYVARTFYQFLAILATFYLRSAYLITSRGIPVNLTKFCFSENRLHLLRMTS